MTRRYEPATLIMRIALLTRAIFGLHGYGGLERHVLDLARFLVRSGQNVTVVTMPPRRPRPWAEPGVQLQVVAAPRLPLRGIPDRVINYPYWSRFAAAYIAGERFDLVHAHGLAGWGYARLLAQGRARAPLIMSAHGLEEFKTSPAKQLAYRPFHYFERQAAQQASAIIASDSAARQEIPRYLHVAPRKVVLIPNGIDIDAALADVSPEAMEMLGRNWLLNRRSPILLSVGRLEANKGFDVLIDALARIRPSLPSTWLWLLVGDGPERMRLEEKLRAYRLDAHAWLVGSQNDITLHNLYELATLFVHPTLFEGSSLVTLEAMAHRRPVVASAAGGIPDKVLPGRNGYLVEPGNAADLGDKIVLALRDARRLREMGEESYAICRQTFDWAHTIRQTLALYRQLIQRPPAPRAPRLPVDSDMRVTPGTE